jgi:hypothetical protein
MERVNNNFVERRKYIRLQHQHILYHEKYDLRGHKDQKIVEGVLKNYSPGGVLFETKTPYRIGDLLKLEMAIPGWERFKTEFYKQDKLSRMDPVIVLASVIRVECIVPDQLYENGVCFVGIDEGDRWALIKQIKEELNRP